MALNSIEANKDSCKGYNANTEGERWQYPNEICILVLPLIPSSFSPTAVLRTCKFLVFQVSSAPWPCALHMERWREVAVLGNAKVYVFILSLIVLQYGACPCHLMQRVGEKGCHAALGCDCSSTHCKPCSYKARIGGRVKCVMYLPQKTIGNNRAWEGTMFNRFIAEQSQVLLYTFILLQTRYLCLDLKYIYP